MTRKHTRRRFVVPLPPRGLRPKLARDQLQDLALCHLQNLDTIAKGHADEATLWDYAGSVMTWSKVAQLLQVGEPEMQAQLELAADLVARYGRTGRVLFDGQQYQLAKQGIDVMDQLAELVDRPTAVIAAEWSEQQINKLAAQCRAESAATV